MKVYAVFIVPDYQDLPVFDSVHSTEEKAEARVDYLNEHLKDDNNFCQVVNVDEVN